MSAIVTRVSAIVTRVARTDLLLGRRAARRCFFRWRSLDELVDEVIDGLQVLDLDLVKLERLQIGSLGNLRLLLEVIQVDRPNFVEQFRVLLLQLPAIFVSLNKKKRERELASENSN